MGVRIYVPFGAEFQRLIRKVNRLQSIYDEGCCEETKGEREDERSAEWEDTTRENREVTIPKYSLYYEATRHESSENIPIQTETTW